MKKTRLLSGGLAMLWIAAIFSLTCIGYIYNRKIGNNLYVNCDGESIYSLDSQSMFSESAPERIYTSPMKNYFYNLRDNFGYNIFGSCGYVALGMLLTYYDSYWDDGLVPELLEQRAHLKNISEYSVSSSPGSMEGEFTEASSLTKEEYVSEVIKDSNLTLHGMLIRIGKNLGYDLGTTTDELKKTLEVYLDNSEQIVASDWKVYKNSNNNFDKKVPGENITYSDMMLSDIKNYLKRDIPVLVAISSGESGHAVIAYDYNEVNDTVYANFGWHNNYNSNYRNIFSLGYKYVMGYIVMETTASHSHTYNYLIDWVPTCSCALPNHKHIYTYKSEYSTGHNKKCFCGFSVTENHRFQNGLGVDSKYLICQKCGYMKLDDGNIRPVLPNL